MLAGDAQLHADAIGPIDPSARGAALARSVLERGRELTPGIVEFAARGAGRRRGGGRAGVAAYEPQPAFATS